MGFTTALGSAVFPNLDLGLGRRKKGVDVNGEMYVLGTLGMDTMFSVASIGAGVANTTIQGYYPLAGRMKVPKLVIMCTAIAAVTGTHSFNIVLGTAAYTASATSIPGNDNASVPPVGWNSQGQPAGAGSTYAPGGGGLATNQAVAGNTFWNADVPFNTTLFPNLTTGTGTGTTFGQILLPNNPDAIWPNSGVLTLRVTTPASTGSITNLIIAALLEPQPLSASFPSSQSPPYGIPVPDIDF